MIKINAIILNAFLQNVCKHWLSFGIAVQNAIQSGDCYLICLIFDCDFL